MLNAQFFNVSPREQREADLFFAELTGRPPFRPHEDQTIADAGSYTEAVAKWNKRTVPGTGVFIHNGYKVEARWNFDKQAAQARPDQKIDMVVYLHGYGAPRRRFLAEKARNAGLDMVDSNGVATVRNNKPTLALVPKATVLSKGRKRFFRKLYKKKDFDNLLMASLRWLELEVLNYGTCALTPGKVTLMAHSGGGAAMNRLLNDGLVPDEVVCFDSTYGQANPIIKWAERKILSGSNAEGGLRIFYLGGGTANAARQIKTAVNRALQRQNAGCAALARRYRVEQTRVGHGDIPKAFSGLLLNDITATVPRTTASRSPCIASTGRSRAEDLFVASAPEIFYGEARDMEPDAPLGREAYNPRYRTLELKPSSAHGGTRMSSGLPESILHRIMPDLASQSGEVKRRYLDLTNDVFSLFAIDTIESRALFLAHAKVETDQYKYMVESDMRTPYRLREVNAQDPKWRPHYVTPQQEAEYQKLDYHNNIDIMGRGRYLYIGRGPLQVTTYLGYKRAVEVLNVWGQELGRRGAIQESARLLHASGELDRNPALAAIPEFGFLLSGAFFKAALPLPSGLKSLDMRVNKRVPVTAEDFLRVSGSMFGAGSFQRLRTYRRDRQKIIIDNLNRKVPVFRNTIQVLCRGGTSGVCANQALKQTYAPITRV